MPIDHTIEDALAIASHHADLLKSEVDRTKRIVSGHIGGALHDFGISSRYALEARNILREANDQLEEIRRRDQKR